MKIRKLPVNSDLSVASLLEAVHMLEVPAYCSFPRMRLQVNPGNLVWCHKTLEELGREKGTHVPWVAVEVTPVGKPDAWALWYYEDCVWSEGA